MLALIYSAGLRSSEVSKLEIADVGLKKYLVLEKPNKWLFNRRFIDKRYNGEGLSWVMREALKNSNIKKQVKLHSLRHSYATHLLEDGVNIVMKFSFFIPYKFLSI